MNWITTRHMIAAAALAIAGLVFFALIRYGPLGPSQSENQNQNQQADDFVKEGYAIKDSPGFKPGIWYLSYEDQGKPGQSAELAVDAGKYDLQVGQRVRVIGRQDNGIVTVSGIQIINASKNGSIWIDTPLPGSNVYSPVTMHGYAKGGWYFEASFPVKLFDSNGKLLGQTAAQAQGDWMSEGYVEFMASLSYALPGTSAGTLVFQKDNPSGLAQHDDQLQVPVVFGTEGRAVKLYYYDPNKDKDGSGNVLASRQGLVAVNRQIPITITPIQDTIKLLLQGNLTSQERANGITTEYPLPGFELKSADLKNNVLTLQFSDPQNKTGGGSARVGVLWFQIEATAKQFPGVSQVKFLPEELFQP